MSAPEKIYRHATRSKNLFHEAVYADHPWPEDNPVEYIRADLHNDHVASAWRSNGKLMDKIDIMQRRIDGLREERDALRNGMAKFTMDTLGEMVKFSPPPPIHLTVTQEQADKIIAELRPQFCVGDLVTLKDDITDEDLGEISIEGGRRFVPSVMTVTRLTPTGLIHTDNGYNFGYNFKPTMLECVK